MALHTGERLAFMAVLPFTDGCVIRDIRKTGIAYSAGTATVAERATAASAHTLRPTS
jgi:hypothetical protein